jgi:hypothetical protein
MSPAMSRWSFKVPLLLLPLLLLLLLLPLLLLPLLLLLHSSKKCAVVNPGNSLFSNDFFRGLSRLPWTALWSIFPLACLLEARSLISCSVALLVTTNRVVRIRSSIARLERGFVSGAD